MLPLLAVLVGACGVSLAYVVLAGLAILATGFDWIDPLVSLVIAALIIAATWGLMLDSLRMALAAITNAEVAGDTAKELSDDETLKVVAKEAKKRKEAIEAYQGAGREDLAAKESAELVVLEAYLPAQLSDEEIAAIVDAVVAETGASGMQQMGQVMKGVQEQVAGRADGGRRGAGQGEIRRHLRLRRPYLSRP